MEMLKGKGWSCNNARQKMEEPGDKVGLVMMVGVDRGVEGVRDSSSGWLNGRALDF